MILPNDASSSCAMNRCHLYQPFNFPLWILILFFKSYTLFIIYNEWFYDVGGEKETGQVS